MQVDAVQQRAAELGLVAVHLVGRAAAGALRGAQKPAGAGVHGRNHLKTRRKLCTLRGAGDGDVAGLQRLAQGLQRGPREFRQFIQKENALVGQRNFARARGRAAAHQRHRAGRVVRLAGRPLAPGLGAKAPGQAGDGGALQCFFHRHRRQQPRKTLGQHRFSRARWPCHQYAVAARSGNLQRALGAGLALHVGHVGAGGAGGQGGGGQAGPAVVGHIGIAACHAARGQKRAHHVQQVARAHYLGGGHQRGFFGAAGGQHQLGVDLLRLQCQAGGQRAAHGAQLARQRQLARKLVARQAAGIHLAAGGEDAQGNRQVKPARVLGQIGRGQIDGDAFVVGEFQPRVLQRRAHALAGLLHLHLGQPHQREAGQAVGQMHFHGDRRRQHPQKGAALHQSKTHEAVSPQMGAFVGVWALACGLLHQMSAWRPARSPPLYWGLL